MCNPTSFDERSDCEQNFNTAVLYQIIFSSNFAHQKSDWNSLTWEQEERLMKLSMV